MKVQHINSQTNFHGSLLVDGLSKSQQKVFNRIKDDLYKKVADKDYLILHIDGSVYPMYRARYIGMSPKYILMHTQVKPATEPTANILGIDSLNPNDWLKSADQLIHAHLKSDLYKKAINGELDGPWTKLKKKFMELINNYKGT